jgi:DDE superfamily endonuclease
MMPNNESITVGKKQHTLKNTVMSLPNKLIVFLGRTFSGHNHDYIMLKQELPPELDWFTDINVRVDLGYLGIQSDYRGDRIDIPTKKPRKSQKNPNPQLSEAQKAANTALSQVRIFIEHAIGGMKRYNILVHVFRNRKADFEDDAVGICAGLWNFALSYWTLANFVSRPIEHKRISLYAMVATPQRTQERISPCSNSLYTTPPNSWPFCGACTYASPNRNCGMCSL